MNNHLRLLLGILALLATCNSAPHAATETEADFVPLMNSLERFHGDKATWSFENGVLSGKASAEDQRTGGIFTVERFGNFVLRFQARADSRGGAVFVRSAIHPIEFLGGYAFRLGPRAAACYSTTFRTSREWPRLAPKACRTTTLQSCWLGTRPPGRAQRTMSWPASAIV